MRWCAIKFLFLWAPTCNTPWSYENLRVFQYNYARKLVKIYLGTSTFIKLLKNYSFVQPLRLQSQDSGNGFSFNSYCLGYCLLGQLNVYEFTML